MTTLTDADRQEWDRRWRAAHGRCSTMTDATWIAGNQACAELREAKAEHEAFRVEVDRVVRGTIASLPEGPSWNALRSLRLPDPEPDLVKHAACVALERIGRAFAREADYDKYSEVFVAEFTRLGLKLVKDESNG